MLKKAVFALVVGVLSATIVAAGEKDLCTSGDYWIFKIIGKNPVVQRGDEINGTYKIKCDQGRPVLEAGDISHFMAVIPSVPGLSVPDITKTPPYFKFLEGEKKWQWDFTWAPPGLRGNRVEQWVATFEVQGVAEMIKTSGGAYENAIKITRGDRSRSVLGWRTYEYYFSKQTGSVVKMSGEWKNGTTYESELIEYKRAVN